MPAAVAIPAAVSAGSSIFGGIMGSRASGKAARQQAAAAEQSGQLYRQTAANLDPMISETAAGAGHDVSTAAGAAGHDVSVAAGAAGAGVSAAADRANGMLQPYMAAGEEATGTLRGLLAPGGDLNRKFTMTDFQELDPGFSARLAEANRALAHSQAARGNSVSGGAMKEIGKFNQDYASNEVGQAFGRFSQQNNDRFSRLSTVMGTGLSASDRAGANTLGAAEYGGNAGMHAAEYGGNAGMRAAEYGGNAGMWSAGQRANIQMDSARGQADAITGAGNARAAGTMGSANAWSGAVAGAANGFNSAYQMNRLFPTGATAADRQNIRLNKLPGRPTYGALPSYLIPQIPQ